MYIDARHPPWSLPEIHDGDGSSHIDLYIESWQLHPASCIRDVVSTLPQKNAQNTKIIKKDIKFTPQIYVFP